MYFTFIMPSCSAVRFYEILNRDVERQVLGE